MSNKTLFVITEKSELERWDISRKKLSINDTVTAALTNNMVRRLQQVFAMAEIGGRDTPGTADLSVGPGSYCVVKMPVYSINLNAPFAVEGSITYPHFDGPHPVQRLVWAVPDFMSIFLCAHINSNIQAHESFLVAVDHAKNRSAYRLPLSNLYADCRLCTGRYEDVSTDILSVCRNVWKQFHASNWNDHLYTDATELRRKATRELFAFDISEAGFAQRKVPDNWTKLCEKVGTEFITNYIV